jgi:hypothetical protein
MGRCADFCRRIIAAPPNVAHRVDEERDREEKPPHRRPVLDADHRRQMAHRTAVSISRLTFAGHAGLPRKV